MPPPSGHRGPIAPSRRRRAAALAAAAAVIGAIAPSALAGIPPLGAGGAADRSTAAVTLDNDLPDPLADVLIRARSGLVVPPGAIDPPSLAVGRPAEVQVRLGPDPLGLAAALGVEPAGFWRTAGAVVSATGPGVSARGRIQADGSARLSFTPLAPGPVRLWMRVTGKSIERPKGFIASLVRPGEAPWSPVLQVEALPVPAPDPGGEPAPEPAPVPAPIPGPEPAPTA